MLDQGYITQDEYDEAMADDVYSRIQVIDSETDDEDINSYFVDALTNQVLEDLENNGYTETQAYTLLYSGGLNIYSTQDPEIQKIADDYCSNEDNYPADTHYLLDYRLSVRNSEGALTNYSSEMLLEWMKENSLGSSLEFNSKEEAEAMADQYKEAVVGTGDTVSGESLNITPQPQISMTIEDQHTGEIVAMVGGRGERFHLQDRFHLRSRSRCCRPHTGHRAGRCALHLSGRHTGPQLVRRGLPRSLLSPSRNPGVDEHRHRQNT